MDAGSLHRQQHEYFLQGQTQPAQFRMRQLQALKSAVLQYEPQILAALAADMRRPATEAYTSEVLMIVKEIDHALNHLRSWMQPRRVATPWMLRPGSSHVLAQPYGSALIIGPWNYPFQLLLCPLVGAIAAGNTAVLKVSEIAARSAAVIADMLKRSFAPEYIAAVEGGPESTEQLLDQPFDCIFFTGSVAVGRIVMRKAASHLTPVTLELGGKNPCVVTPDTHIDTAARRICWGKFFNAGQTCVAPDYVLVHTSAHAALLAAIERTLTAFYGGDIRTSADYGRIVNRRHFDRLRALLDGQRIYCGGGSDAADLYIAPTVITEVTPDNALMQEEIFGPLLPVLTYSSVDEAIDLIRAQPKPLALYLFCDDRATQQRFLQDTASGAVNINDTLSQVTSTALPFGGVGASGMGRYHGEASFRAFSNERSVLHRSIRFDNRMKYAPYRTPLEYVKRVMRWIA